MMAIKNNYFLLTYICAEIKIWIPLIESYTVVNRHTNQFIPTFRYTIAVICSYLKSPASYVLVFIFLFPAHLMILLFPTDFLYSKAVSVLEPLHSLCTVDLMGYFFSNLEYLCLFVWIFWNLLIYLKILQKSIFIRKNLVWRVHDLLWDSIFVEFELIFHKIHIIKVFNNYWKFSIIFKISYKNLIL
jgi:hypothetical protein